MDTVVDGASLMVRCAASTSFQPGTADDGLMPSEHPGILPAAKQAVAKSLRCTPAQTARQNGPGSCLEMTLLPRVVVWA